MAKLLTEYVGRTVKGVRFTPSEHLSYSEDMRKNEGCIGNIEQVHYNIEARCYTFGVKFPSSKRPWFYPANLLLKQLEKEKKTKYLFDE